MSKIFLRFPATRRLGALVAVAVGFLTAGLAATLAADDVVNRNSEIGKDFYLAIDMPDKATAPFEARWLEDRRNVSIVEVTGDYDKDLDDGSANTAARLAVAREYFAEHADEVDFLVAFTTFEIDTGTAVAFYTGARNDTQGLGLPIFDGSASFGSAGRLQGFVDMADLSRYVLDSHDSEFEWVLGVAAHEVLHRWGVHLELDGLDGQPGAASYAQARAAPRISQPTGERLVDRALLHFADLRN